MSLHHFYPSPISEPDTMHPDSVISPTGIIHVLGYTPIEGEPGAPISVRAHFAPEFSDSLWVRLVVGDKPVLTKVRELTDVTYGRWQLDCNAPPFDYAFASSPVPLTVQALDKNHIMLDSTVFGEFSYWTPGSPSSSHRERQSPSGRPKLQINTNNPRPSQHVTYRRRTNSLLPTPSPTSPSTSRSIQPASKSQVQLHRRPKTECYAKNGSKDEHVTPILDLDTSLQSICVGWSPAEMAVGRRLVRFSKVQDGPRLIVSCEPIRAEEYHEADSVISCIYRETSNTYYVTSVDIIFLLERLTNSDFPVEEKNRIRRNLEGLHPTTVSKHKHGFEDFFQRIMEFPDPKPRNIEKDLKVFEWALLDQALDKILSKYTVDTSAVSAEGSESSGHSPFTSSDGSEFDPRQFAIPVRLDCPEGSPNLQPATATLAGIDQYASYADVAVSQCPPGNVNSGPGSTLVDYVADMGFPATYDALSAFHGGIPGETLEMGGDTTAFL